MNQAEVEALVEKYESLLALRLTREEVVKRGLNAFPLQERPARRQAMRALASRFPGSLRELDGADVEALRGRLAQLEATRQGKCALPWMKACSLFHAGAREVLAARLRTTGRVPRRTSGRLLDGVWSEVGKKLGLSAAEAERLVYPCARLNQPAM